MPSPRCFGGSHSNSGSRLGSPRSSAREVGWATQKRHFSPPAAQPRPGLAEGLTEGFAKEPAPRRFQRRASPPLAHARAGIADGLAKREDFRRDEATLEMLRQRRAPQNRTAGTADVAAPVAAGLRVAWEHSPVTSPRLSGPAVHSPRLSAPVTPVERLTAANVGSMQHPVRMAASTTPPPVSPRSVVARSCVDSEASGKPSNTGIKEVTLGSNAAPGNLVLREESCGMSLNGSRRRFGAAALSPRGARAAEAALAESRAEEWNFRTREAATIRAEQRGAMRWRS